MKVDVTERRLEEADKKADELWNKTYGEQEVDISEEGHEEPVKDGEILDGEPPKPKADTPPTVIEKPTDEEEETFKKKFVTLQGKYDAEVPRYAEQVRLLKEDKQILLSKIADLEEKVDALSKATPPKVEAEVVDTMEEDLKKLDLDYPDVGKTIQKYVGATKEKIAFLEKKLSEERLPDKETAELKKEIVSLKKSAFDNDLKTVFGIPNWKEIDDSEEFTAWLEGLIPYTNLRKFDVLQDAARKFDAARVAQFFKDFLAETKTEVPPQVPPVGDENEEGNLERLISPPDEGAGSKKPPKKPVDKNLTREAYIKFMKNSSRGKFDPKAWGGKTEEEVEAMFHRALTNQ